MNYTQLTREQRYQISALKSAGHYQYQIATLVGVHPSTISRELRRNLTPRERYGPKQAHDQALQRRRAKARLKISGPTWHKVMMLLKDEWSPEQIAGRLSYEKQQSVSHGSIYQHIYADKKRGGTLHKSLRCQKQRRKRYGTNSRRGLIPHRISIDKRPKVVDQKSRTGDWEADTIIGRSQQGAIVSSVERKTKLTLLQRVERKSAAAVTAASLKLLRPHARRVQTITSDNGTEFCGHQQISAELSAKFYFAHPYCSWERGLNENTNGLVRQYFPKKTNFSTISDDAVKQVMEKLNHRPRKTLGYKTPDEVFFGESIALTT